MFWSHTNVTTLMDGAAVYVLPSITATAFVRGEDGDIYLEYHGSRLVTYHADNTFTISHCNSFTATTKKRLCTFGPGYVVSLGGIWWHKPKLHSPYFELIRFNRNLRVEADGYLVEEELETEEFCDLNEEAIEATLDNQIAKTFL